MTRHDSDTTPSSEPSRSDARRHALVHTDRPMALEGGGSLRTVEVAYETWGELNADASNAVLVCHALTGDSHAGGVDGWWADVVGPGLAVDTERWFVVCSNVLGGCQGTTGPMSIDPTTGSLYGPDYPVVSIRDMVRVQAALADELGIDRWHAVVGGSMGGMQAAEWAVMYPNRVGAFAVIASTLAATAQQIAWSMVGRRSVMLDPEFKGGRYEPGGGPRAGLGLARAIAMIHYRSEMEFTDRFDRRTTEPLHPFQLDHRFEVERYLDYHGDKLFDRFDANTYLILNKAMDLHDVARGRGDMARALGRVSAPALIASVDSDALYPPYLQEIMRDQLQRQGVPVAWATIESRNGHDGFLTDGDQLHGPLQKFLDDPIGAAQ